MTGRPTLIVSNRSPVTCAVGADGEVRVVKGEGGVATALLSVGEQTSASFIACVMNDGDRIATRLGTLRAVDGRSYSVSFVDPGAQRYDLFYNTFANPLLWFLQHGLWDDHRRPPARAVIEHAWTQGYVPVNQAFADRIVEEGTRLGGRPRVLLQDYHLYGVAGMVRRRLPDAQLQLFVHIPWAEPKRWDVLPRHITRSILQGMLANDVVGFQTARDAANFGATCARHLGATVEGDRIRFHGRETFARVYPIGIDPVAIGEQAAAPAVDAFKARMEERRPEHIVFACGRVDPSKNIDGAIAAFGLLLDRHPELVGRAQLWLSVQPSRGDIPEYAEHRAAIETAAAELNARHPGAAVAPVLLDIQSDYPRSLAGFRMYDVFMVNPRADGMNLVAKEGPMVNERFGAVVLSRNAGAHDELGRFAVTVDPADVSQQADALYQAINMPMAERAARVAGIREAVRRNTVFDWIGGIVADLNRLDVERSGLLGRAQPGPTRSGTGRGTLAG